MFGGPLSAADRQIGRQTGSPTDRQTDKHPYASICFIIANLFWMFSDGSGGGSDTRFGVESDLSNDNPQKPREF